MRQLMIAAGAGLFGGGLSWLWANQIGDPRIFGIDVKLLPVSLAFGVFAGILGAHFAKANPGNLLRFVAISMLYGFAWKPTIEVTQAYFKSLPNYAALRAVDRINESKAELESASVAAKPDAVRKVVDATAQAIQRLPATTDVDLKTHTTKEIGDALNVLATPGIQEVAGESAAQIRDVVDLARVRNLLPMPAPPGQFNQ